MSYLAEWEDFAAVVRDVGSPPVDGRDGRQASPASLPGGRRGGPPHRDVRDHRVPIQPAPRRRALASIASSCKCGYLHGERSVSVLAAVLNALSNDGRRQILHAIADRGGDMTSGEIAEQFSTAWSTTTRHLAVLQDAGLVSVEKRGREEFYRSHPAIGERALQLAAADLRSGKEQTR